MQINVKNSLLLVVGALLLFSVPAYLFVAERPEPEAEPVRVLITYLKATYARDYRQAYSLISAQDRRFKKEDVYIREHGAFAGFTLEAARKLSAFIEARPVRTYTQDGRAHITLALKLPDAGSLSELLLNWDEERLNALSRAEQKRILASLDRLKTNSRLTMIQGEEDFTLAKEKRGWRVYLDWAAGVRVNFAATVPPGVGLEARPTIQETVSRSGELFNISYRVKNRTAKDLYARIVHHIEPKSLAEHLDLVECALLLPVRLLPGEEKEYTSTYLLQGDLPEDIKELNVTYEFKLEH
jgi:Cytochrome c oxidase assembly protein CtaG/Cox11